MEVSMVEPQNHPAVGFAEFGPIGEMIPGPWVSPLGECTEETTHGRWAC
jgi:hypothetical protein